MCTPVIIYHISHFQMDENAGKNHIQTMLGTHQLMKSCVLLYTYMLSKMAYAKHLFVCFCRNRYWAMNIIYSMIIAVLSQQNKK